MTLRRYWVVSPLYTYIEWVDPEIGGPTVASHDSECVVAPTVRTAIVKGVAKMRARDRDNDGYFPNGRDPSTNPHVGFTTQLDIRQHDLEIDGDHICAACEAQVYREMQESAP